MPTLKKTLISLLLTLAAALGVAAQYPSLKALTGADVYDTAQDKFSIRLPKTPYSVKQLDSGAVNSMGTGVQYTWMLEEGVISVTHISFKKDLITDTVAQAAYSTGFMKGVMEGLNGKKTGELKLDRKGYTAVQATFDMPGFGQGMCRSFTSNYDHFIMIGAGYTAGEESEKLILAALDSLRIPDYTDAPKAPPVVIPLVIKERPAQSVVDLSLKNIVESETFSSAEDKFAISLPQKAAIHKTPQSKDTKGIVAISSYEWPMKEAYIAIARFSSDRAAPKTAGEFQAFTSTIKTAMLEGAKGTFVSERPITLGEHKGVEIRFTVLKSMNALSRLYVVGNDVYALMTIYDPANPESEKLSIRAFDTFRVLGAPGRTMGILISGEPLYHGRV